MSAGSLWRKCEMFGKPYVWVRDADGRLMLLADDATFSNVPQRYAVAADSVLSFEDLRRAIVEVEPTEDGWRRYERR